MKNLGKEKWLLALLWLGMVGNGTAAEETQTHFSPNDWECWMSDGGNPAEVFRWTKDGLNIHSTQTGWLVTKKEYCNFTLSFEIAYPTETFVDSGLTLRMGLPKRKNDPPSCIEVQLKSTDIGDLWGCCGYSICGKEGRRHSHREADTGDVYTCVPRQQIPSWNVGEWNRLDVTCRKNRIQVRWNGETLNEGEEVENVSGRIGFQAKPYPQGKGEIWIRRLILTPE